MRNYWWPRVIRDVRRYVDGCNIYQRMKNRTEAPVGKLKLSKVLEKLWTHLTVDFIMKLLLVAEKDIILVVCDRLSKMTYFVTITEGTLAEELARLFRDNVWKLHGLLENVVIIHLDTNIFLFLLFIFLDFIFLFFWFSFSFSFDNKEAYDWDHMTYHMMWGHRPRTN